MLDQPAHLASARWPSPPLPPWSKNALKNDAYSLRWRRRWCVSERKELPSRWSTRSRCRLTATTFSAWRVSSWVSSYSSRSARLPCIGDLRRLTWSRSTRSRRQPTCGHLWLVQSWGAWPWRPIDTRVSSICRCVGLCVCTLILTRSCCCIIHLLTYFLMNEWTIKTCISP